MNGLFAHRNHIRADKRRTAAAGRCREVVGEVFSAVLSGIFEFAGPIIDNIIGVFQGITTFLKGVFSGDFKMAFQG